MVNFWQNQQKSNLKITIFTIKPLKMQLQTQKCGRLVFLCKNDPKIMLKKGKMS